MNNFIAGDISQRANIIAELASFVYFNIPEEFGNGPESFIQGFEEYTIEELEEIKAGLHRAFEKPEIIGTLQGKIKESVNSLFTSRLLIVSEITMSRPDLVQKILLKGQKRS